MNLRGIKLTAAVMLAGAVVTACTEVLPGGQTGPFAPGNELTFYYQTVLTDPPEKAQIVSCGNEFVARSCIRLSSGATFPLETTETGAVSYGNDVQRVVLQQDPNGLPSGVGMVTDAATGEQNGLRWVSLPQGGAETVAAPQAEAAADAG